MKGSHDQNAMFTVRSDVAASPLGDELAILDLRTGEYFTLNETGAFLWSQLASPKSQGDLCADLLDHFEVDEEVARSEVSAFLAGLSQVDLVEIVGA